MLFSELFTSSSIIITGKPESASLIYLVCGFTGTVFNMDFFF